MIKHKVKKIGVAFIILFLIHSFPLLLDAQPEGITFQEGFDNITIITNFMTLKINSLSPYFTWWNSNSSSPSEKFNIKFISIKEFFGDDEILDSPAELGGISYDLAANDWDYRITYDDNSVTVELQLSGLANGAEILFVLTIYNENKAITGTDHFVDALSEIKFDIIVNNWPFSINARGLALFTYVFESLENSAVKIRDGTLKEDGNATQSLQFECSEDKTAFFEWTTFANVYNGANFVKNITVRKASLADPFSLSLPISPSKIPMYLTYPNYGNSLKLVHDPSIGVYPGNYSASVDALSFFSIVTLLVAFVFIRKYSRIKRLQIHKGPKTENLYLG
ncbi:MAG: hypothetical protein ACTSWT_04715 [Candidatus Heimdallarchaeota archaeon]